MGKKRILLKQEIKYFSIFRLDTLPLKKVLQHGGEKGDGGMLNVCLALEEGEGKKVTAEQTYGKWR